LSFGRPSLGEAPPMADKLAKVAFAVLCACILRCLYRRARVLHRLTLNSGADGGRYDVDMALFSKLSNDLWQGESMVAGKGNSPKLSILCCGCFVTHWLLPPAVISLHWPSAHPVSVGTSVQQAISSRLAGLCIYTPRRSYVQKRSHQICIHRHCMSR